MHASPITRQWIEIAPGFAGYLATPPAGAGPGLLLFQEIFGVNAHIQQVADQYAMDGFTVLAPDVFWRQAPRVELGYAGDDRQRALELMKAYGNDQATSDIQASAAALRGLAVASGPRIGAIGYCMGGRLAYLAAAGAVVDTAVAYYGGGIQNLLDRAGGIRCPIQYHYAGHDENIPPAAVEAVRAAMAGKPHELHLYPQGHHGFNCWARAAYHAPSAALAHGRTLTFLAQALWP